ncbi:protein AAR2 homolog [Toxorhynchites rutilus septentrionalis]|uniref:protein AAR2 homolog n=1 Tax=Toxorhynchites rutilus septentrionalis TaxID=329112 RepID=UPI0024786503|nr:protein AAR2 homolog [Toxorhynchites rutilus septentrionalis]
MSQNAPEFANVMDHLSPDVALKLFETSAVLIIAGVPVGTEFGIDERTFIVGENFRGVKMIPDGVHVIYCASQGPYGDSAPRVGFTHFFKAGEIVIREWDNEKEELRCRTRGDAELEKSRIKLNLCHLDKYLAPYDYTGLPKWKQLTGNITESTVIKHSPDCGLVRNTIELLSCTDDDRPKGGPSAAPTTKHARRPSRFRDFIEEEDMLPDLKSVPGTAPNFTELPPRCPKGSTPFEISQHYMDAIVAVERLLQGREEPIFAEIQFSFILFLCCHSVESLSHWRKILLLLSNSEQAVEKFRIFYRNYLTVLQTQIPLLPIELMEQTQFNTVYSDIKRLLLNCYQAGLTSAAQDLEKILRETVLWSFDDLFAEDPDEMPTVVDL